MSMHSESGPNHAPMPTRCELHHRVFTSFGDVHFRRSTTDGAPVLTVSLGEREAQIPLGALKREFAIKDESLDGQMLVLIAASLDYVSSLQPGDRLPSEVVDGRPSWRPSPNHIRLARTRLRLNLLAWLSAKSRWADAKRDELSLLRLADDADLEREVQAACIAAARVLKLRDGAQVMQLLECLAAEMSYIEAMRHRLLMRVERLCRRVAGMMQQRGSRSTSFDTLSQVQRLSLLAFRQIRVRFDDVDTLTAVFDTLACNVAGLHDFIRNTRDWLYRSQRAWEPLLLRWNKTGEKQTDGLSGLLAATYQFLAPRFMPTTEWHGRKTLAAAATPATRPRPAERAPTTRTAPIAQMAW